MEDYQVSLILLLLSDMLNEADQVVVYDVFDINYQDLLPPHPYESIDFHW